MTGLVVAVGQCDPHRPADVALSTIRNLASEAADAGAQVVIFPEGVMHEFGLPEISLVDIAEPLDGPFVSGLIETATRLDITLVAGMWESAASPGRVRNTAVAVDRDGIKATYRKAHLFDSFGFRESDVVECGPAEGVTFEVSGMTIGLSTCYDVRFPELYADLAMRGVDAVCVIAGWVAGPGKVDHWETLLRARAIETTSYVIGADLCGPRFAGHSGIWDPFGVQLAKVSDNAGVITASITMERVAEVRQLLPSLQHKRFEVAPAASE